MSSFQQITLVGNVGGEPELKFLPSGVPVCNFSLAVNEVRGSGETRTETVTWFRIAVWRQLAETVAQWLSKGRQVMVVGKVSARAYTDKSGNPAVSLDVNADQIVFLGARGEANGAQPAEAAAPAEKESIPF